MSVFALLATGPSLTREQVQAVRGLRVVAVSDAWALAPWAEAMVSADAAWWRNHPEAWQFAGRKFTAAPDYAGLQGVERLPAGVATSGVNSGLLGLKVAVHLGATRVLILGLDLKGDHFFGPHPAPMRNTTPERFEIFKRQFAAYRPPGVEVLNCTPGSALTCYPRVDLEACLSESTPALAA